MPISLEFIILVLVFLNSLLILAVLVLVLMVLTLLVVYARMELKDLAFTLALLEQLSKLVERAIVYRVKTYQSHD